MSAAEACPHCADGTPHSQWVSFLVDGRLSPEQLMDQNPPPNSTYIDFSRQPLVNLACHARRRRYAIGPKVTKHMAKHIKIELLIGPFYGGATLFVQVVKKHCRRWRHKFRGGIQLARAWHRIDAKRQGGAKLRVFHTDSQGHKEMMERVLAAEDDQTSGAVLERAARVLVVSNASLSTTS